MTLGMREQRGQRVAHHAERRLGAGREQQPQEAVDLLVGELLAVDLGVHEIAEEVARRVRAAVLDERREVVAHRLRRGHARSGCSGPVLICSAHWWNCAASSSGTPTIPQITCTGYLRRDRRARDRRGRAARSSSSSRSIVGRTSVVVPLLELRRAERVRDEVAVRAVLLAVHREDQVAHELADVLGVDRRRERLAVAQHLLDVVAAGHLERRAVGDRHGHAVGLERPGTRRVPAPRRGYGCAVKKSISGQSNVGCCGVRSWSRTIPCRRHVRPRVP